MSEAEMVFCDECGDFALNKSNNKKSLCKSPKNLKDSWMSKGREYIGKPQDRNRNNDCPDFNQKEE